MDYGIEELSNRILYFLNLPNVTKPTKYMIWDSVQNQLGNYSIKIKDIVITLSDLEDKNLIKNTYYEINEQGRNKIRANPD